MPTYSPGFKTNRDICTSGKRYRGKPHLGSDIFSVCCVIDLNTKEINPRMLCKACIHHFKIVLKYL